MSTTAAYPTDEELRRKLSVGPNRVMNSILAAKYWTDASNEGISALEFFLAQEQFGPATVKRWLETFFGIPTLPVSRLAPQTTSAETKEYWGLLKAGLVEHQGKLWLVSTNPLDPRVHRLAAKHAAAGLAFAEAVVIAAALDQAFAQVAVPSATDSPPQPGQAPSNAVPIPPLTQPQASSIGRWVDVEGIKVLREMGAELVEEHQLLLVMRDGVTYAMGYNPFDLTAAQRVGFKAEKAVLVDGNLWLSVYRSSYRRQTNERPKNLVEALKLKGFITPETVKEMAGKADAKTLLLGRGEVSEEQLAEAQALLHNLDYVDLLRDPPAEAVKHLLSETHVVSFKAIPHSLNSRNELVIVLGEPENPLYQEQLRQLLRGRNPRFAVATPSSVSTYIDTEIHQRQAVAALAEDVAVEEALEGEGNQLDFLVDKLISDSVAKGASDIHIEPVSKMLGQIRLRIDGDLYKHLEMPLSTLLKYIQKLKMRVGSAMNFSEKRKPQDGALRHQRAGLAVTLRLSTVNTVHGEKLVARIFRNTQPPQLDGLGMLPHTRADLDWMLNLPYGLVVIVGPTGSGKTNTGLGMLNVLAKPHLNISTVENPVEFQVPGVNHIETNEEVGAGFSETLRALMRQDPDIIYVGEIRDQITAETAVKAALTGHLVVATMHANDALAAVTRFDTFGLEMGNVSEALQGVIAQRLVKKPCPKCASRDPNAIDLLGQPLSSAPLVASEKGCEHCGGRRFLGRSGLFETLRMTPDLKYAVGKNRPLEELRGLVSRGWKSMFDDGVAKVELGTTTPQEVLRVASRNTKEKEQV